MQVRGLKPIIHNLLPRFIRRPLNIGAKMRCFDCTLTIEYRTKVVESPFLIPTHEKE